MNETNEFLNADDAFLLHVPAGEKRRVQPLGVALFKSYKNIYLSMST
jgi:hypothetical protein